jgi:8-oxo-dGTP pyrophosphatase MutT (NUDIX family)
MSTPSRIIDPHLVPVVGVDAHLPAVPGERLTAQSLRALKPGRWSAWQPLLTGDGRAPVGAIDTWAGTSSARRVASGPRAEATNPASAGVSAASVLVPLIAREEGLQVLLTRRTEHLKAHAGQISFPGGRAEPTDCDPVDTALREAEEEIGLARDQVEVLGSMPAYTTVTGFEITPVVALVHPPLELRLDAFEVAESFEVPLAFLMDPAHHRRHLFQDAAGARQFLSMPWRKERPGEPDREFFIWGATAAMLRNLYEFLGQTAGYHGAD